MGIGRVMGSVAKGAAAGALGTLAMDLLWWSRARRDGSDAGFAEWELSTGADSWDEVGAPAQVGRRIAGLAGRDIPESSAGLTNDVVHWATGVQWGALYGFASASADSANPLRGLSLGWVSWAASYATLGPAGIYRPIWEYDAETLGRDLSAHVVFGLVTASTYRLLSGRGGV